VCAHSFSFTLLLYVPERIRDWAFQWCVRPFRVPVRSNGVHATVCSRTPPATSRAPTSAIRRRCTWEDAGSRAAPVCRQDLGRAYPISCGTSVPAVYRHALAVVAAAWARALAPVDTLDAHGTRRILPQSRGLATEWTRKQLTHFLSHLSVRTMNRNLKNTTHPNSLKESFLHDTA
jgi:hypothetical protein